MPAKYPRLTITMRPALHALLRRLSELTGTSQSALIFELLDGAEPTLLRVIRLLETAQLARNEIHGKLTRDMESAQERIEHSLKLTLEDLGEDDIPDLVAQAEAEDGPKRRRRRVSGLPARAATAAEPTPLSNRGVRSLTTVQKTSAKRRSA